MVSFNALVSAGQGRFGRALLVLATGAMLGACSASPKLFSEDQSISQKASAMATPSSQLEKATDYWGREFASKPQEPNAALNYARNLKALGNQAHAFNVLQQAHTLHPQHREIASEFGRLAVALDKNALGEQLLHLANNPAAPDWRVLSGLGAVHAKRGEYAKSIDYFERAQQLAPNQPSVLNNLALAYAASGDPKRAEALLRTASASTKSTKVSQNLALVVGLQGRHGEAKDIASRSLPVTDATANAEFMSRMVKPQLAVAKPAGTAKPSAAMLAVQKLADQHTTR